MKKNLLLFTILLIAFSAQAELVKVTIAESFLNKYKPVIVLIHAYDGEIIHLEQIKKRDLKQEIDIEFDNAGHEKFALTTYITKEWTDEEFSNYTFFGITNNYILRYEKVNSRFEDTLYGRRVVLVDHKPKDIKEIQTSSFIKSTVFNLNTNAIRPIYFSFSTNDNKHYYYLNDESRQKKHVRLEVGLDQLHSIDSVYNLTFGESTASVGIRAYSKLINKPISFGFSVSDTSNYQLPFPSDLQISHFDITTVKVKLDTINKIVTGINHYFSIPKLPFTVDSFDQSVSINQKYETQFRFNVPLQFKYIKGALSFNPITGPRESFNVWFLYGPSEEEFTFTLPELPENMINKFPVFDIGYFDINGHIEFISTDEKNGQMRELSSPFQIGDKDWRLKNSSTVVTQNIPYH